MAEKKSSVASAKIFVFLFVFCPCAHYGLLPIYTCDARKNVTAGKRTDTKLFYLLRTDLHAY